MCEAFLGVLSQLVQSSNSNTRINTNTAVNSTESGSSLVSIATGCVAAAGVSLLITRPPSSVLTQEQVQQNFLL